MRLRLAYDQVANVCLTGSTGYIGSSLATAGHYSFEPITTLDELCSGCTVLHLAAATDGGNRETLLSNLEMDTYLADWAEDNEARVVYASGNCVYANSIDCDVEDCLRPLDYYSASKIFGETLLRERLRERCCILRIGDVFGVGQRHGALFNAIERLIVNREPLVQIGDGLKLRTYIYIEELVRQIAYAAAMISENRGSGTYNVGHAEALTVRDLLARLSELADLPIDTSRAQADRSNLDVRSMRIAPLPGYTATFTMDTALQDYVGQLKGRR
ncbi:SDR family oxidoreductase [Nitratireductor aquimarinus]|uniref:NAD-dependent epimerase/dehydratase family protein n=1 Tax=Nitratireductor TaxID=245876 RepID=UPI0019D3916C|nr:MULTISPECIES: SDR family oxidoreductase [Nitratireductor]MBN7777450.1 SDR family oxidoreductase [Nitratireductor pacificus]MBN7781443.1 SDR family oxidoreductase [Nitratireductor pacificus]MBN7790249.1 SDR family oxidoreductase [Nitratireductor aquimarinus]MBY6099659.1 SDR family oxidoreductase [Nitratireductor aquimarinus]MCA1261758.1 SDR family oxidoreductase [Nitratireductor aquimarinus]